MSHSITLFKLQNQADEEFEIKRKKINELKQNRIRTLSEPLNQETVFRTWNESRV